jgi:hypothetical protein
MASRQRIEGDLNQEFVMGTLGAEHWYPVSGDEFGDGYMVGVGPQEAAVSVAVYPEKRSLEIFSGKTVVRLSNVQRVSRIGQQLCFEAVGDDEQLTVDMTSEGGYSLRRLPFDAAPQGIDQDRSDETPAQEKERVTLRGRVGKAPLFRMTARRGMLIGSFPLGTHPDLETTIWHSILVFGDRAQKLKEKGVTRGQEIEVVGYPHERVITSRNGGSKTVTEIYATAIRTTLRQPPGDSQS